MSFGTVLRLAVMALAVVGVIRLSRDEFGLALDDYLDAVVKLADDVVEPVAEYVRPWIEDLFDWLGWRPAIQYHWIYAYGLMQLFLGAYARSKEGWGLFRWGASFLFSLVFGILAGTVHLAHLSVFLYPAAGFLLFLAFNRALDAATESSAGRGSWWSNFRAGGLSPFIFGAAAVAYGAYLSPLSFIGSEISKSFGLLALLSAVFLFGVYLLLFGFPGHGNGERSWRDNPGTKMGFSILAVLLFAWGLVSLSEYRESAVVREPTIPIQETGGFRDCLEAYCPLMKPIPAGTFEMGADDAETAFATSLGAKPEEVQDEKPRHKVAVGAFALSITEVTRAQFAAFVEERRYKPSGYCWGVDEQKKLEFGGLRTWENPGFPQQGDHPAVCITWWDVKAYADFLSRKTGHKYRLPSEAEWEYAARAGTTTSRYWGQANEKACEFANVWDAAGVDALEVGAQQAFPCNDSHAFTAPVGTYRPNAFGLHDMLGNVWEWTADCYNESYSGAPQDGTAWEGGNCNLRVVRGGSWLYVPWFVRSAYRNWVYSASRCLIVGFRVARTND